MDILYAPNTSLSQPLTRNIQQKQSQTKASTIYTTLNAMTGKTLQRTKQQFGLLQPDNVNKLVNSSSKPGGNAGGKH